MKERLYGLSFNKEEFAMKNANLIFIDPINNNNRVYNMTQQNEKIIVEMGRQGSALFRKIYPMSLWDNIYQKKIKEGYVDRTAEFGVKTEIIKNSKYKDIEDTEISEFIDYILSCTKKAVESEISISHELVSEKMVLEAQNLIKEASDIYLAEEILNSEKLLKIKNIIIALFTVIPRKMKDVFNCLPQNINEIPKILEREQSLLDAIKVLSKEDKKIVLPDKTILDVNGLSVSLVSDKEEKQIKSHLGNESVGYYNRAFKVNNTSTAVRFYDLYNKNNYCPEDIHYLYHGTGNANIWGIMTEGLLINPNAPITGKMFGYGIYFANRAKKSINYTDLSGSYWRGGNSKKAFLFVYKVLYKNPMNVYEHKMYMTSIKSLNAPYDALFAHKGVDLVNDEIIIYNEAQCTLQYIIELKAKK